MMKPSSIEWIGNIPDDWKTNTAFQVFTQVKNKNDGLREQNLLSLSYGRIKRKSIETVGGLLPESFDGYNIIEADDIVLRLTDLQNDQKSLRVGLSPERGIVTSAYLTLRNRSNSLPKYLYYYLHAFDISKGFYGMGAGVRQGLNWDGLKWLKILTPPVHEQEKIVSFLDTECARIDAVIEQTRASIEEYKKLKQSVITQAVTKGIRPCRKMKDSGIEWVGEIPEDWGINTFFQFFTQVKNKNSNLHEQNLLSLSYGKIKRKRIESTEGLLPESFDGYNIIEADDIVLRLTDLQNDMGGGIRQGLNWDGLKWIKLLTPPKEEQTEIVRYCDTISRQIDTVISGKERLVNELESYKKSLIFEYVTGKKEVPV